MAESSRPAYAVQFFIRSGLKPWQAAGLVGTFMQESGKGLNPEAMGDGGTSFGIGQWRGDRFTRLKQFAGKKNSTWKDFGTQLEFSLYEMQHHETYAWNKLRAAKTVEQAAAAAISYERPLGWSRENPKNGHGWSNRLAFANSLAGIAKDASTPEDQSFNMGGATGAGGGTAGEPAYDPNAKDDMIPGSKTSGPPEDFNPDEDQVFFDDLFSAEEDQFAEDNASSDEFGDIFPDPPMGIPENLFDPYWPQQQDDTGYPDPPPPPEFGGIVQLPEVPNIFRQRLLGQGGDAEETS